MSSVGPLTGYSCDFIAFSTSGPLGVALRWAGTDVLEVQTLPTVAGHCVKRVWM